MNDFAAMNGVYASFFPENPPARSAVEVARLPKDAMVEIEGRNRLRFQARMAALLREEAVAALKDAKANHDKLEGVYNPYVDFDGVRELAAIETGRLLRYLG